MTLRHAAKAVSAAGMARLCLVGAVLALVFVTTATELRAEGIRITNNYEVANSYPSRLYGYIQNGGCLRWDFFATKGQTVQHDFVFCFADPTDVRLKTGGCPVNSYCPVKTPVCTLTEDGVSFGVTVSDPSKYESKRADGDYWVSYEWVIRFDIGNRHNLTKWMQLECH